MTEAEIAAALDRAQDSVDRGRGLGGTGFWKAVSVVKRSPDLVERFADRIAEIDRRAFEDWALLVVPNPAGNVLAGTALAGGVAALAFSTRSRPPSNFVLFGGGSVALLASTHGLGHLVAGRAMGMRFTHWFVASAQKPQPGVKVDYSTYLRTPAQHRAWMHAAGALVTKTIPFVLMPVARRARMPRWVRRLLAVAAGAQIVTDAVWSVKQSDWKKFRREMSYVD